MEFVHSATRNMLVAQTLLIIFLGSRSASSTELGAQYLQDTIESLKLKTMTPVSQVTSAPIKRAYGEEEQSEESRTDERKVSAQVPSLHLTKSELAELYEKAISKGETITLDPGDGNTNQITAAVHEIGASSVPNRKVVKNNGFYYYYYPLKSFADEISTSGPKKANIKQPNYVSSSRPTVTSNHYVSGKESHVSHTHQHNVHIEPMKHAMEMEKKKGLEPLYMAISGFVGMTVMFILSMLVLPKLNKLKPKGFTEGSQENMIGLTNIAMQAIEGYDCSERILCESAKAAKVLHLSNNRFIKLIRKIGPKPMAKNIGKISKYTNDKYKCATIPCNTK